MEMIDLRSDTVTKPTAAMKEAMFSAPLGDDVFGADPSVNLLQEKLAKSFGMEAALFCPSGTMTNQIAIRISTQPQDEVICDQYAHVYLYEGGGMMYNSMVSPKLLPGDRGRITATQVKEAINADDIHMPVSRMVAVENTMNKGGGAIYDFDELKSISEVCKTHDLKFHLDGARLFNALVETGQAASEYGKIFDTISICFSKGLGTPVGSVLLGSADAIKKAKRVRKVLGGGMRQAGLLAAACTYALDHHVERLKEDHARARVIGKAGEGLSWVSMVYPVDTNIVIFKLADGLSEKGILEKLNNAGLLAVGFGKGLIRFVSHLDFDDNQLSDAVMILKNLKI